MLHRISPSALVLVLLTALCATVPTATAQDGSLRDALARFAPLEERGSPPPFVIAEPRATPSSGRIAELREQLLVDDYSRLKAETELARGTEQRAKLEVEDAERQLTLVRTQLERLRRTSAFDITALASIERDARNAESRVVAARGRRDAAVANLRAREAQLRAADPESHRRLLDELAAEERRLRAEQTSLATGPRLDGLAVEPGLVIVRLTSGASSEQIDGLIGRHNLTVTGAVPEAGLIFAQLPGPREGVSPTDAVQRLEEAIRALRAEPIVVTAAANTLLQGTIVPPPSNLAAPPAGFPSSWAWSSVELGPRDGNWGQKMARFPCAWNFSDAIRSRHLAPPTVGVLDVGFFPTHGDLALHVASLSPPTVHPHGNHVAGIIGALFDNGLGVNGCTPFVNLEACAIAQGELAIPAEVGGAPAATATRLPDMNVVLSEVIATLVRLMANTSLKVVNLSLGYNWVPNYGRDPNADVQIQDMVRAHGIIVGAIADMAATRGIVLVCAAGNDSRPGAGFPNVESQWASPFNWAALNPGNVGTIPGNIIVVESVNSRGERSAFSNVRGRATEGTIVAAPGENILSTVDSVGAYRVMSGTSMAAPHVTALVALLQAYRDLAPAEIVRIVRDTARPGSTPDGAPVLDAFAAMLAVDPSALKDLADLNADGSVDRADLGLFRQALAAIGKATPTLDLNGDGVVDKNENIYPRADLNCDGSLSAEATAPVLGQQLTDMQVLLRAWTDTPLSAAELSGEAASQQGIVVEGFSITSTGRAADAAATASLSAAAVEHLGPSWKATLQDSVCAPSVTLSSTESTVLSVGQAWEEAYQLEGLTGSRVEPNFVVPVDTNDEEAPAGLAATDVGAVLSCERDAVALADPMWSLSGLWGANVTAAWALMAADGATARPGAGVVIGHPDTGFTRHPEIWAEAPGASPVTPEDGWNFFEDTPDPTDPLTGSNPGHGTKTASVLVSAPGPQPGTTGAEGTTGVAPGASLIPYRVTDTVALFRTRALANAICRAAHQEDPPVDVISMSLGGIPSRRLHEAIQEAVRRGIIVLAAAGNGARIVVWPARYPEVIAVAASNSSGGTWKGSSRGRDVDISAPGQAVWAAVWDKDEEDCVCAWPGCGTSYAVATTAGVAALWLDYRRADLEPIRRTAAVPLAFADILRSRGFRTPTVWDSSRFGPGILDAQAALTAPIPSQPAASAALVAADTCGDGAEADREALLSLFEQSGGAAVTWLGQLLRSCDSPCSAAAKLGDELAFHAATSETVQAALAAMDAPEAPSEETLSAARRALLQADISVSLRGCLE